MPRRRRCKPHRLVGFEDSTGWVFDHRQRRENRDGGAGPSQSKKFPIMTGVLAKGRLDNWRHTSCASAPQCLSRLNRTRWNRPPRSRNTDDDRRGLERSLAGALCRRGHSASLVPQPPHPLGAPSVLHQCSIAAPSQKPSSPNVLGRPTLPRNPQVRLFAHWAGTHPPRGPQPSTGCPGPWLLRRLPPRAQARGQAGAVRRFDYAGDWRRPRR